VLAADGGDKQGEDQRRTEQQADGAAADLGGPGDESQREQAGERREHPREPLRPQGDVALGAQHQETGAVQGEQRQGRQPTEQGVQREQVEEATCHVVCRIHLHPAQEVRERNAEQQRGSAGAADDSGVAPPSPTGGLGLASVLDADPAQDQPDQQQREGEVEAREDTGVPLREGGERRATCHDEPDLVAVPERPDRAQRDLAVRVGTGDRRQQQAHPEVEPFEQEEAGPQDRDECEPECLHGSLLRPG